MSELASEVCPSSAAFFGFMGVASSMVFGSEYKMVFSDEKDVRLGAWGHFDGEGRGREGSATYLCMMAVGHHLGRNVWCACLALHGVQMHRDGLSEV